jgi:lipopolysaccharide export system protein LptA
MLAQSAVNPAPGVADTASHTVQILNAEAFNFRTVNGVEYRFLTGNVKLKHETTYMECDSALIYKETNSVDAFGHVYINDKDSVRIYCDTAKYNGALKLAHLFSKVVMTNGRMKLLSPEVYYDLNTSVGNYYNRGKILNDKTVINSIKGTFYNHSSDAFFRDSVVVTDPQFKLNSDTLKYNTDTHLATFYAYTHIVGDSTNIYCLSGHYNTQSGIADFGYSTYLVNGTQQMWADSLYYERMNGLGKAYIKYKFIDHENNAIIFGTKAIYKEKNKYIIGWERPLLVNIVDGDSLYLRADTVITFTRDTTSDVRNFFAFPHVRYFKKDLQGVCDSFYYSFSDSTFRMFYAPYIWSDSMQLSGDTIFILTKAHKVDELQVLHNGFIAMHSKGESFDQIKGNYLNGFMRDNQLDRMHVRGSAQSIYYAKNDNGKFLGTNKALCAEIWLYFKDKKVESVHFYSKPEAVFTPMKQLTEELKHLDGFNWRGDLRPKSKDDL